MLLSKALLFSIAASGTSAVLFYGSGGPNGDYVNCTTLNVVDNEQMVVALENLYAGEVQDDTLDFKFQEAMACGDDMTRDIEFNCHDLGGNATCIRSSSGDSGGGGSDEGNVQTRADSTIRCSEYTGQCYNEYQSSSGACTSGYTQETYEVRGFTKDVWCTKTCTDDESKKCLDVQCNRAKGLCTKAGGNFRDCGYALKECKGQRVKMSAEFCGKKVLKYIATYFEGYCGRKVECVSYADGYCTVNMEALKDYRKRLGIYGGR